MKAMILSAGVGSRLKPFTDHHPKALAPVNRKSLLRRNIEYLNSFGITDIIVNVHHFPDQIINELQKYGLDKTIKISDESDELLETGGGMMKASWFLKDSDPFVMINVDVLTDMDIRRMIDFHINGGYLATLAVMLRQSGRYFLFDEADMLCGWRNANTGDQRISREGDVYVEKAFSGIHVVSPEIFSLVKLHGRFSMVDVYLEAAKSHCIAAFDHSDTLFIDVGKPDSIKKAEDLFN